MLTVVCCHLFGGPFAVLPPVESAFRRIAICCCCRTLKDTNSSSSRRSSSIAAKAVPPPAYAFVYVCVVLVLKRELSTPLRERLGKDSAGTAAAGSAVGHSLPAPRDEQRLLVEFRPFNQTEVRQRWKPSQSLQQAISSREEAAAAETEAIVVANGTQWNWRRRRTTTVSAALQSKLKQRILFHTASAILLTASRREAHWLIIADAWPECRTLINSGPPESGPEISAEETATGQLI